MLQMVKVGLMSNALYTDVNYSSTQYNVLVLYSVSTKLLVKCHQLHLHV